MTTLAIVDLLKNAAVMTESGVSRNLLSISRITIRFEVRDPAQLKDANACASINRVTVTSIAISRRSGRLTEGSFPRTTSAREPNFYSNRWRSNHLFPLSCTAEVIVLVSIGRMVTKPVEMAEKWRSTTPLLRSRQHVNEASSPPNANMSSTA
jgi:hypothetical protein